MDETSAPTIVPAATPPAVRTIDLDTVVAALGKGLADFRSAPMYGLAFGGLYAIGGLVITWLVWRAGIVYLAYPLAAGFALVGPFVAVGLYEVSRRLAAGEALSFGAVFNAIRVNGGRELGWMALVTGFALVVWLYVAGFVYAVFFGLRPIEFADLVTAAFTTPRGFVFLVVGTAFGALLSVIVYSVTVVAVPLLVDRDVDFVTAMVTSVRAVVANPKPMLAWAAVVVALLVVGLLPAFLGLALVLPVLGHATWHLYKSVVE